MSEETSEEVRIMTVLAELRDDFKKEIDTVTRIASGKRAEEGHLIEAHSEKIEALETLTTLLDAASKSHAAQLKLLDLRTELMSREIHYSSAVAHRLEKKMNALLVKWGIEDPAASPTDTPKLTRPKP